MLIREAVDEGIHRNRLSKRLDPDAWVDYNEGTRPAMRYDRIVRVARELVDLAVESDPRLSWQLSSNRRSTEILLDPFVAVRVKLGKANRGGRTANYPTERQLFIRDPRNWACVGQTVLPFRTDQPQIETTNRIWLTARYDLDELEENVTEVEIGVEHQTGWVWRVPLPEAELDVIARVSPQVADLISDLRNRRGIA